MTTIPITRRTLLPMGPVLPNFNPIYPRLTAPVKLMCVGTSITVGTATTGSNAYRLWLWNALQAAGLQTTFLGKFSAGTNPPSNPHFGVVGSTLPDHMLPNTATPINPSPTADNVTYLAGLAPSARPDLLIHEIGINDSSAAATTTNFGANMTTYIAQLEAIQPFRHVWSVPPMRGDVTSNANLTAIGNTIISTVAAIAGGGTKIVYADARMLQLFPSTQGAHYERIGASDVHPNDDGDLFKAAQLYGGILLASGRSATFIDAWNG